MADKRSVVARGVDSRGRHHVELVVPQGEPPRRVLRQAGFRTAGLRRASWELPDRFVIEFDGYPASWHGRGRGLSHAGGREQFGDEPVAVRQRLAAYGVVTASAGSYLSEDSVLLTSLSGRVTRPGLWILPGGGIDPGEAPNVTLRREVWEESGQQVSDEKLLTVVSGHRVGRTAQGEVEDFHAIRLVFSAHVAEPGEPVVHDVGGSTQEAVWWPLRELAAGRFPGPVAPWVQQVLTDALASMSTSTDESARR